MVNAASNIVYQLKNYKKHNKLGLQLLIYYQWTFTLIMIIAIGFSYRHESLIIYTMIVASTRNALALFDFDDNRKTMDKQELL